MRRLLLRLISGLPAAALVLGVSTIVHLHVRYTPRCTILTDDWLLHVSHDGRWLLTNASTTGPVSVWDATRGQVTAKYLDTPHRCDIAPHRELVVGAGFDETMRFVDWRTGETRSVVIGDAVRDVVFVGRWCVVKPSAAAWMVIDLDNGRVVGRFPARGRLEVRYPRNDQRRVYVRLPDSVQRWNLEEMRLELEVPAVCDRIDWPLSSEQWLGTLKTDAEHVGSWTVWDMRTGQPRHHFGKLSSLTFSAEGSRMALVRADQSERVSELEVVDTQSGQITLKRPIPDGSCTFSIDHRFACVINNKNPTVGTVMIDVATGKTVWEESYSGLFLPHANVVLPDSTGGAIREANTGNVLFHGESVRCSLDCRFIVILNSAVPKDALGRWLARFLPAVFGDGSVLQVVDADSMREVYRLRQPVDTVVPGCTFAEDGSVLVTCRHLDNEATAYRLDVWNMNPWRARIAAGISALATMLVVLTFHRWRRRRAIRTQAGF